MYVQEHLSESEQASLQLTAGVRNNVYAFARAAEQLADAVAGLDD